MPNNTPNAAQSEVQPLKQNDHSSANHNNDRAPPNYPYYYYILGLLAVFFAIFFMFGVCLYLQGDIESDRAAFYFDKFEKGKELTDDEKKAMFIWLRDERIANNLDPIIKAKIFDNDNCDFMNLMSYNNELAVMTVTFSNLTQTEMDKATTTLREAFAELSHVDVDEVNVVWNEHYTPAEESCSDKKRRLFPGIGFRQRVLLTRFERPTAPDFKCCRKRQPKRCFDGRRCDSIKRLFFQNYQVRRCCV